MARINKCGPYGFCKGTNLTRKGKFSSTSTEPLRNWARVSSLHYSLGRPNLRSIKICFKNGRTSQNVAGFKAWDLLYIGRLHA